MAESVGTETETQEGILYEVADGVGRIQLNRPARKNAMTLAMVDEVVRLTRHAREDPHVRVLIVTGSGDAFCSGVDLSFLEPTNSGLSATPLEVKAILTDHMHELAYALTSFDKPLIAAVNGVAVGAGMDLALMCDLRVAGRSARFCEGYIRVGLVPGAGGAYLLPRLVGPAKALELLLTGDMIDADEALRIGIVSAVVDDVELADHARQLALRIAAGPPVAASFIKRAVQRGADTDLRTSLELTSSMMGVLASMSDTAEALRAMRERRPGHYEGR